jgi:cytochrome c oxidase cbb3-type subunit 4
MNTYTALRHFADSWGLLFMVLMFVGFGLWTFRRSAKPLHDDAANMIFKEDDNV